MENKIIKDFLNQDVFGTKMLKLRQFAYQHMRNNERDWWVQFNENIDLHFIENDDRFAPSYGELEVFAYRVFSDDKGNYQTDTLDPVRIL